MNNITLSHQGRDVAVAAASRFWLASHIEALPDRHPRRRLVCFMVLYARDVLTGALPGPYSDTAAERFAIACLIPSELLERADLDIERAATALGIPIDAVARAHTSRWPRG